MRRLFNLILGALAMLAVAMLSAFITMRLAIHGREVKVPNLAGSTLFEAASKTSSLGLRLNLENRFYSADTPPGRVLAQSPTPGDTVRREWTVRVTESLGPQQVVIPDVVGQSERTASVNLRRLSLDAGTVAHMAAPGDAGVVLAQTPNPKAVGIDSPRVSLLLSQPEEAQDLSAFVMPSLTGLTLSTAAARAAAAGLHIVSAEEGITPSPGAKTSPVTAVSTLGAGSPGPAAASVPATATPMALTGTVVAQTPLAGHRVVKSDPVRVTLIY